jgi:transposase-like protein
MSAADIQAKAFTDNDVAREAIEALMWPNGPVCPHCGCTGEIGKIDGKSARPGLYYCGDCKKQFTVTVGTIFERSKVPLSKWWMAIHLMASSKKGMSAHQLHRMLGVAYQTAWFMEHRIREAMRDGVLSPMGGGGGVVEIDETYIGRKDGFEVKQGAWHKNTILTLVERDGRARSFHVDNATKENIVPIIRENIDRESHVMTDEASRYSKIGSEFAKHGRGSLAQGIRLHRPRDGREGQHEHD